MHYNFGEEDPNYNNSSVIIYAYSSFKNLEFCYVKDHTELDLVLSNDCQPNAKVMLTCHPNEFKLNPNIFYLALKTAITKKTIMMH